MSIGNLYFLHNSLVEYVCDTIYHGDPVNTKTLTIVALVVLVGGGAAYLRLSQNNAKRSMKNAQDAVTKNNEIRSTNDARLNHVSRYVPYTKAAFDAAVGKKRVYFFYAAWSPDSKAAEEDIMGSVNGIPKDVVLFKTNYDTEAELKQRYTVTRENTFVWVDDAGNALKKWSGSGTVELIDNTK